MLQQDGAGAPLYSTLQKRACLAGHAQLDQPLPTAQRGADRHRNHTFNTHSFAPTGTDYRRVSRRAVKR